MPEEIRARTPTTDTYSLAQTQEEFYFGIPLRQLDLCVFALDRGMGAAQAAAALGLATAQVEEIYRDIAGKRVASRYQHEPPLLVAPP